MGTILSILARLASEDCKLWASCRVLRSQAKGCWAIGHRLGATGSLGHGLLGDRLQAMGHDLVHSRMVAERGHRIMF